jgi:hypothetical protein
VIKMDGMVGSNKYNFKQDKRYKLDLYELIVIVVLFISLKYLY